MRETWDFSMPLEEAMTTQRAVRRLKPDPVDDALVLRLIELALKAPSGSNAQNWEFIVVRDPAVKAKLARRNRQAWQLYARLGRWLTRNDPKMPRVFDAVQWQADHFEEIPVLVVACLRGSRLWFPPMATASYYGSVFPSVQNLLLAARAVNLGAALITLPLWSTWSARRILGCPWSVQPCAVIPLGWPRGRYGPTTAGRWAMWSRSTAMGSGLGRVLHSRLARDPSCATAMRGGFLASYRRAGGAGIVPQNEGRNRRFDRARWVCVPGEASEPALADPRDPMRFARTPWQIWVGTHTGEHGPGLSSQRPRVQVPSTLRKPSCQGGASAGP